MNRAQIEMRAREDALALLTTHGIPTKTGEADAFVGGFRHARVQLASRDHDRELLTNMVEAASRGAGHIQDRLNSARLLGRALALDEALQARADDDSDDDKPTGPHKFSGTNLMKCKDCGMSINAKVHKQSWPANRK